MCVFVVVEKEITAKSGPVICISFDATRVCPTPMGGP